MVLDGETGFLVPSGDVAALAAGFCRLATDRELRVRMGEAGRRRANGFQWESTATKLFANL